MCIANFDVWLGACIYDFGLEKRVVGQWINLS